MPKEFISEYGLDPGDYVNEMLTAFQNRCEEMTEQHVEEAIFFDGGPVDYLAWFVLDDYTTHTFFYNDDDPDKEFLKRLLSAAPTREAMPKFKHLLNQRYETNTDLEIARLLVLPDVYEPQTGGRPRVNFGYYYEPNSDRIVAGLSGSPRMREPELFEDANKIIPDRDLDRFVSRTVEQVHAEIEAEADRHTIEQDIRPRLRDDPDCRLETTKPLPEGIHPKYTGEQAELWQKPASYVPSMEGSQGFLQLWVPVDEPTLTLVSVTAGNYDKENVVDAIREEYTSIAP